MLKFKFNFFFFPVNRTTYVAIDVDDYYSKKFKVNTIIKVTFVNLKRLLELDKIFQLFKIFQIFNSANLTNETNYEEESMEQNDDETREVTNHNNPAFSGVIPDVNNA